MRVGAPRASSTTNQRRCHPRTFDPDCFSRYPASAAGLAPTSASSAGSFSFVLSLPTACVARADTRRAAVLPISRVLLTPPPSSSSAASAASLGRPPPLILWNEVSDGDE